MTCSWLSLPPVSLSSTVSADDAIHPLYGVRIDPVANAGPRAFRIRASSTTADDTAFRTIMAGTITSNDTAQEFIFPQIVDARYLQFVWETSVGTNFIGVQEVAVLAIPANGAALLSTSSQRSADESPLQLLDVDRENGRWVTADGQTGNQGFILALPRQGPWTIDHVALQPDAVSPPSEAPRSFQIQVSTTTWEDAAFTTVLTGTLRNDPMEQHWFFTPTPARYVRMIIVDTYGGSRVVLRTFRVYSPDIGSLQANFLDRSRDASRYQWDFGDGTTSTERDPQHIFTTPGVYTVTLTVGNAGPHTDQISRRYVAFGPPQPNFTATPESPTEGQIIQFRDTSTDAGGSIAYRRWDWGDGNTNITNQAAPSYIYRDNEQLSIALTVANARGITATVSQTLTIGNAPPTVQAGRALTVPWGEDWSVAPTVSDPGLADRPTLTCQWDFGDGHVSPSIASCSGGSGASVPYRYTTPGPYTATLTVRDKDGGVGNDTVSVVVTTRPTTLLYTGDRQVVPGQPTRLRAKLRDTLAWQPLAGKSIQFMLGGQTISAVTNAEGLADVTMDGPSGASSIIAAFAGDEHYGASGISAPASCATQRFPLDVAVVLDRSSSMSGQRMDDARTGAKIIAESLDLAIDQVGLLSFAEQAQLNAALTHDLTPLLTAIDRIDTTGGTAIHVGLTGAIDELNGVRRTSGAGQVIIVLSDGESDLAAAQAAAAEVRAIGIRVITLAVGRDNEVMKSIASSPSDYYLAPTSEQLAGMALSIIDTLCDTRPTPTPTSLSTPTPSRAPTITPTPTSTPLPTPTAPPLPYPTQVAIPGWIGGPAQGTLVSSSVPITLTQGINLIDGTLEYWPVTDPTQVTTIATQVAAAGGETLATLDTTQLTNGAYMIRLRGIADDGRTLSSGIQVTIGGEYKPGRVHFSVADLTVPVAGLPIAIGRTYDSLERGRVGDFGYGWNLSVGSPRLEVDGTHHVTLMQPGGKRVTFFFTPTSYGGVFGYLLAPSYTAEAGVFGTLTADGCPILARSGGKFLCFLATAAYQPTSYTYTDPYGRVYRMSADGTLKSITDLNRNTLTFSRDGITSSTGALNVPFLRDAQGRITQVTDPAGQHYRYEYDAAGDLVRVVFPAAEPNQPAPAITYRYDATHPHLYRGVNDPLGRTISTNTYYTSPADPVALNGRLRSVETRIDALRFYRFQYTYDLAHNTITTINPDGGRVVERYAQRNLPSLHGLATAIDLMSRTQDVSVEDGNIHTRTTQYAYDTQRNLTVIALPDPATGAAAPLATDPAICAPRNICSVYDSKGNPVQTTDPLGNVTRTEYNQANRPIREIDPLGQVRESSFDARGNFVRMSDALGTLGGYSYTSRGQPQSRYLGNDPTTATTYTYDSVGRLIAERDPVGTVTRYDHYDGLGNPGTITEQGADGTLRAATLTYNGLGRMMAMQVPLNDGSGLNITTRYEYDLNGNQSLVRDDTHGWTTATEYDYQRRATRITQADGTSTSSTYTWRGQPLTTTDPAGTVTRFTYNLAGDVTEVTTADGTSS